VAEAAPGPCGWFGHPQKPKTHFNLFLFFVFLGVARPPLGHGGGSTTPRLTEATPDFHLFLFYFILFLNLMAKTTSFWVEWVL
jgi:hypothetical protein